MAPPAAGSLRRIFALARTAGAGRAGWGVVDQGVSSLTNFAVTLAAAHQAGAGEFGGFAVAFASYIFLLWVARSLLAEPFIVRFTAVGDGSQRQAARSITGAALLAGSASAVLMAVAGAVVGGTPGTLLATMAVFMPALLAQDAYRYVLLARGETRAATVNDTLWFAVQAIVAGVLFATGHATVVWLAAAFGASGAVAACYAVRQTRVVPAPSWARAWLGTHRDLAVPFVLELVAVNGMSQLTLLAIALVGEVVAVGEMRASVLLLSPLTVLFSGLFLVAVPEAVRLRRQAPNAILRLTTALAVATVAATVAWGALLALLPDGAGNALLRSNWVPARRLLPAATLLTAATACSLSAVVGLRALQAARRSLRARAWSAPVTLVLGLAGAKLGDAMGATVGLAAAAVFLATLSWVELARALRGPSAMPDLEPVPETPNPASAFPQ